MKYQNAFTLTELMVTLAVAAVLAMMVTPFSEIIRKNRNSSLVQEFATSLNLARSEAIKRGSTITVCKRKTPDGSVGEECDSTATWANGWIAFIDTDGSGGAGEGTIRNGIATDDVVIRVHQAIPDGYTFTNSGLLTTIDFKSSGFASGFASTFTLCDPSGKLKYAHGVVKSINGRIRLSEDSDGDGIREGAVGVNLTCP